MATPSYYGLLNSIAVNEAKGEELLRTWASSSQDAELKSTLEFVAIREGEHAWAFTKRLCELGLSVDEASAFQVFEDFDGLLECVSSDASDAEKVEIVTGGRGGEAGDDPFGGFFKDTTIDPETGALLGRYIAEERDSGRRLRAQYARVCGQAVNGAVGSAAELDELRHCIADLTQQVGKLRKKVKKLA